MEGEKESRSLLFIRRKGGEELSPGRSPSGGEKEGKNGRTPNKERAQKKRGESGLPATLGGEKRKGKER